MKEIKFNYLLQESPLMEAKVAITLNTAKIVQAFNMLKDKLFAFLEKSYSKLSSTLKNGLKTLWNGASDQKTALTNSIKDITVSCNELKEKLLSDANAHIIKAKDFLEDKKNQLINLAQISQAFISDSVSSAAQAAKKKIDKLGAKAG